MRSLFNACLSFKPVADDSAVLTDLSNKIPISEESLSAEQALHQSDGGKRLTSSFISAKADPDLFKEGNGKEENASFMNDERENSCLSAADDPDSRRDSSAERDQPSENQSSKSADEHSKTTMQPSDSRQCSDVAQLGVSNLAQTELWPIDGALREEVRHVFLEFARFGRNTETKRLDVYQFKKLCVECKLVRDTKALPFIELIFFKCKNPKEKRITFKEFKRALFMVSEFLNCPVSTVYSTIASSQGPLVNNITLPNYIKQYDDSVSVSPIRSRSFTLQGGFGDHQTTPKANIAESPLHSALSPRIQGFVTGNVTPTRKSPFVPASSTATWR